jgi:hypothetical protein
MLGLLLLSSGTDTKNADAAFNVVDPTPGVINTMAVDTNITGNTGSLVGTVEPCRDDDGVGGPGSLGVGDSFFIDVVVDEIDPSDGMSGFAGDIVYNPAVLRVQARTGGGAAGGTDDPLFYQLLPSGTYFDALSDALPDTDGDYRNEVAEIGGTSESGEGSILRLQIDVIGAGLSPLTLTDNIELDFMPNPLAFNGAPLPVTNLIHGDIHADGSLCPQPVDVEMTALSLTSPVSAPAGAPFS